MSLTNKRVSSAVRPFTRLSLVWMLLGYAGTVPVVSQVVQVFYDGRWHDVAAGAITAVMWVFAFTPFPGAVYVCAAVMAALAPGLAVQVSLWSVLLFLVSFLGHCAEGKNRAFTVSSILFGVAFAGAVGIQGMFGDELNAIVLRADREISMRYYRWHGISHSNLYESGDVIRGNDYLSDVDVMDIVVDRLPTDAIYLKGFTGLEYTGRNWTRDSEADFEVDDIPFSDCYEGKTWMQIRLESMVFMLNQGYMRDWPMMLLGQSPNDKEAKTMKLHTSSDEGTGYEPYFALYAGREENPYELTGNERIATWFYYEFEQLDPARMKESEMFFSQKLLDTREAYSAYVQEKYLHVPEKKVPGLVGLCEKNSCTGLEDITEFIRDALTEGSLYTRTPGATPMNRDVIEYFMFESRRGFCMHYASAAVLMYRMYGVPARYATGVVARPEDFTLQSDGTYAATLTDLRRHAWVEIYRDNYGWVPVEMTPADYIGGKMEAAGWNLSVLMPVAGESGTESMNGSGKPFSHQDEEEDEEEEIEQKTTEDEIQEEEDEAEEEEDNEDLSFREIQKRVGSYGIYLVGFLGMALSFVIVRRQILVKKQKQMEVRQLFYRILKYAQMSGRLEGYSGQERTFAEKFSEEFTCIDRCLAESFTDIIMKAAYGNSPVTRDERQVILSVYEKLDKEIYQKLPLSKKITVNYVHIYHIFG
ncbi:MAG: transglutaminase domain-containing protein [Lachnospiraceae bacterium]|nr:transglutaminase domain-containing protein [Lachnospiraceae bacterium]